MTIALPPLPYAKNALEPHVSARTLEFHHGAHHKAYVDTTNKLIQSTPDEGKSLEELVRDTAGKAKSKKLFNNAAQAWNHNFFWQCMTPDNGGGSPPSGDLAGKIDQSFGSYDNFRKKFLETATTQFGSGWTWLLAEKVKLQIVSTANAEIPMTSGKVPLLTCDVWEHAYYLDYQNKRAAFVEAFLDHLLNWQTVAHRLERVESKGESAAAETQLFL